MQPDRLPPGVRSARPTSAVSRSVALVCGALLALVGCSDDDGASDGTDTGPTAPSSTAVATTATPSTTPARSTTAPATTTAPITLPSTSVPATSAPSTEPGLDVEAVVAALSSDEMAGRNDGTDGWRLAQDYLAGHLAAISQPAFPGRSGVSGYLSSGASVNVVGIIPGAERPDEYVVIGAHYDGLGDAAAGGEGCRVLDPADTICNGAADNAAGVAVVLAVADEIAEAGPPRRSLVIALWDREEDGLFGSADFLADPPVPRDQMVAYVNFDIQGANLLPSLRESTVMVGAETGGAGLVAAAERATQASTLRTHALSLVFGQGRSDHANFVNAGVPSVFFTDATNGCYHTTRDDMSTVDITKLEQQFATAVALTDDLLTADDMPAIVADAPVATYADAVAMLELTTTGRDDIGLLAPAERDAYEQYIVELQRIVDDGEAAFDDADAGALLGGAAALVDALADLDCDGYLAGGS